MARCTGICSRLPWSPISIEQSPKPGVRGIYGIGKTPNFLPGPFPLASVGILSFYSLEGIYLSKKRLFFTTIEAIEKYKKSFGGFTGPKTGTELRYLYSWGISCDSEVQNLSLCLSLVHFYAQKAELEDPRNPVLLSKPPLFWLLPNPPLLFWHLVVAKPTVVLVVAVVERFNCPPEEKL